MRNLFSTLSIMLIAEFSGIVCAEQQAQAASVPSQAPFGQPTTFDAGIRIDGHKTYVIHGYVNVDYSNQSASPKSFDETLHTPVSGLAIESVQVDLTFESVKGSARFLDILPDDRTGDVRYKFELGAQSRIRQIHYVLYVTTGQTSPWPAPIPGPQGMEGPAGPQGPAGPVSLAPVYNQVVPASSIPCGFVPGSFGPPLAGSFAPSCQDAAQVYCTNLFKSPSIGAVVGADVDTGQMRIVCIKGQ